MAFFFSEESEDEAESERRSRPRWTTKCGGDFGLQINGRVVVMAFIHPIGGEIYPPSFSLHIYDIRRGGPPQLLPLATGLTEMERLAAAEFTEEAD